MPSIKKLLGAGLAMGVLVGLAHAQGPAPSKTPARPAAQPASPAAPPSGSEGGAPSGPVKVELKPAQDSWTKVCGKDQGPGAKEVCYTTRDYVAGPDQPPVLAVAVYDLKGEETKIVRFLMPIGLMLKPGIRFTVDKGSMVEGAYEICFPNGCFAESRGKAPLVDAMKKGTALFISVKNSVNGEVVFQVPLEGFGKAWDGPAIDPKVLEEQQKKMAEDLDKLRQQKEQEAKGGAPGAAAPVTPGGAPSPMAKPGGAAPTAPAAK